MTLLLTRFVPICLFSWYNERADIVAQIVFPAGVLLPPFFSPELPSYVQYGAFGAVVAHEIMVGSSASHSREVELSRNEQIARVRRFRAVL